MPTEAELAAELRQALEELVIPELRAIRASIEAHTEEQRLSTDIFLREQALLRRAA